MNRSCGTSGDGRWAVEDFGRRARSLGIEAIGLHLF